MSFKFNIQETIEKELSYGSYSVYILGGHHIDANPDFYIQIINIETNKEVDLKEKSLKLRDFKFGKKAVKFYSFEIMKHGKFKISVHNYCDIIVKDSMLEVFPFPFLSMSRFLFSKVLGRSREKLTLNDIEIAIV
ncbi:hypothetical protein [Flavobacterium cheniae]|uniref:Uncharacterized protein n=1 Tax=Flavobacterium cheniae TaxID=295428 RepID=A0A562KCD4_9FLAO|nr:hypothetical protein [Flavobacterium cheniae]TDR25290.1 hypothetical protein C8D80_0057 [Flavobacterium cheniae]TWH93079.1 hypothetical protein IP97_02148 [Flavobacterium cheniae]